MNDEYEKRVLAMLTGLINEIRTTNMLIMACLFKEADLVDGDAYKKMVNNMRENLMKSYENS